MTYKFTDHHAYLRNYLNFIYNTRMTKRKKHPLPEGEINIRINVKAEHEKFVRAFAEQLRTGVLKVGQTIKIS